MAKGRGDPYSKCILQGAGMLSNEYPSLDFDLGETADMLRDLRATGLEVLVA